MSCKNFIQNLIKDIELNSSCIIWASLVRNMLEGYGLGMIWLEQNNLSSNIKSTLSLFKQRVSDINVQNINEQIANVSKNRLYKTLN